MPSIEFSGNLKRHLEVAPRELRGRTVNEALQGVFAEHPRLRGYLLDDQGAVRKHVVIYLNDHPIADRLRQADALAASDRVFVFQALSGG